MTKQEFMNHFTAMYRVGNLSDSDNEDREDWTHPYMAGNACCRALDRMADELVNCSVWSEEERQTVYDTL